jgi:hypothetical protein
MSFERRCECDECSRNRRKRDREEVRKFGDFKRRRGLNALREGDKIRVFQVEIDRWNRSLYSYRG